MSGVKKRRQAKVGYLRSEVANTFDFPPITFSLAAMNSVVDTFLIGRSARTTSSSDLRSLR
jgi:hypothetical protein